MMSERKLWAVFFPFHRNISLFLFGREERNDRKENKERKTNRKKEINDLKVRESSRVNETSFSFIVSYVILCFLMMWRIR